MNKLLSVIIPAYNEEQNIFRTAETIGRILSEAAIEYEIIFVDDGSKDSTWHSIVKAAQKDPCVSGISFSRNFGKESAIYAGLSHANGGCSVVIDCDLQHPPEKIVEMYNLWENGYEVIEAVKSSRGKESALHTFAARCFYEMMSRATKIDMMRASDFKLLDRKAVAALLTLPERNAFFRALSSWIGFKTVQIEFDVQERMEGESKWSTGSLVKYAISNVTSFSTAPMQIITFLGCITLIVSVCMGTLALYQKFMGQALEGFTTVIILVLFTSSIIMMSLGIVGYYLAKMYDEIKGRPKYIVAKSVRGGGRMRPENHNLVVRSCRFYTNNIFRFGGCNNFYWNCCIYNIIWYFSNIKSNTCSKEIYGLKRRWL